MSSSGFRAVMDAGFEAFRTGRLEEAIQAYRSAIEQSPSDAEAHSLAGLALSHAGRTDEGLRHLQRAIDLAPGEAPYRFNLAEGLIRSGRYDRALQELRAIVDTEPAHAAAWSRIGEAEQLRGDDGAAAEAWVKAYALDPNPNTIFNLAHVSFRNGLYQQALDCVQAGLTDSPAEGPLHRLRCEVLAAARNWPGLEAAAAAWLQAAPDAGEPWREMSRAAFEQGRHRDAVAHFARFLQTGRHDAGDLAAFAGVALHALDFEAAEAALAAADEMEPAHPEVLAKRALLHTYFGRFDAAEQACVRVLERQPDHAAVFTILSRLRRGRMNDADRARLETLASDEGASFERRIPAAFAVGHAYDAAGDYDAAFAAYGRAHELALRRDAAEGRTFSAASEGRFVQRLMQLFPGPLPLPEPCVPGPRPIFVVGAPRSGTTLIESVLGAHSRVLACGERSTMQEMLRAIMEADARGAGPTNDDLVDWRRAYFAGLPPLGAKDHVTDKHPLNLAAVGLIARLFPEAAIVLVRRDPVETCVSIWRQEFPKFWQFVHRLEDLGAFYGEHSRLAAHWERTLPGRIVPIRYEDFAGDFANAAPALVRACGLDWEPQCLDLANSPNPVTTFSTVDVRDPVAVRAGRAAAYAKHLEPLKAALRATGVEVG